MVANICYLESQVGMGWYLITGTTILDTNGSHQVLACEDNVNLIGDDIRTIERNADVLLNACKDIGLAVNIGKTK